MSLPTGTLLASRYRLAEVIGEGGMGVVYRARDEKLGRDVAVKTLGADRQDSAEARGRLLREARTAGRIDHHGIVKVFDAGETPDGDVFLVMELVRGKTVRELAKGGIAPAEAVRIVAETAKALALAHKSGLVHRDVKPENVMVREDGRVVLLDFGVVKSTSVELAETLPAGAPADAATQATSSGAIIGTTAYLSPEQARAEKIGPGTDQFALAVMAFELLTGRLPWSSTQPVAMLAQVLFKEPDAPSSIRRDLPQAIDAVIARALSKISAERFPTIEAFGNALARAADATDTIRRRRKWPAIAAVTAIALSGAGAYRALEVGPLQASPSAIVPAVATAVAVAEERERASPESADPLVRARQRYAKAGPGSLAGLDLACELVRADQPEEARALAASYTTGARSARLLGDVMLAHVELYEGKLGGALERLDRGIARADKLDAFGVPEASALLVDVARFVGRQAEIAQPWVDRFVLGSAAPSDAAAWRAGDERPMIAMCTHAAATTAPRCFDAVAALEGARSFSEGSLALLEGGRKLAAGDAAGARKAFASIPPAAKDALALVPIASIDPSGESQLSTSVDAVLLERPDYVGISSALPREAARAERAHDKARAAELATRVVDRWGAADVELESVREMKKIKRSK